MIIDAPQEVDWFRHRRSFRRDERGHRRYALLKAATKGEAMELTRRFLNEVGQGTCEIDQLYEMPT